MWNHVPWKRYGLDLLSAAVVIGGITAFKMLFPQDINIRAPFVFYLSAVVLTTLLRGTLCGLLCVFFTAIATWFLFTPKDLSDHHNALLLALRVVEWLWIVAICTRARNSFLMQQRILQSRDQLFALASHELRNPLQAIYAGLSLVQRELPPKGVAPQSTIPSNVDIVMRGMNIMDRQVKKMIVLVDDLLDAARIHAGKLNLHRERLDLCAVVQDVVERFHCPQIEFYCPGEIWGMWDRIRVDQILTNLLSNAIKYGRGKTIRVEALRDHLYARIVVQDQGIGMTRAQQERAFIPFERLGAENSGLPGSGLGLWIVHEIVQSKGGRLTLFSEPDVGTTFAVELPFLHPPQHAKVRNFNSPLTLTREKNHREPNHK
jgi:signal transduction histidine kinase